MADRRYSDDEVRRILALAAEAESAAAAQAERPWSLGDIERIGAEAGIAPQAVSAAALALERQSVPREEGRVFGMPVAVSRTVPLGRRLSDDDWEQLVRELRDTFAAHGRMHVSGARREWRVGNLRVTHEPLGTGAVLELRTRKGDAGAFLTLGAMLLALAILAAVVATAGASAGANAHDARRMAFAWVAAIGGIVMLLVGVLRLPVWARRRARQFEALAAYASRIASS